MSLLTRCVRALRTLDEGLLSTGPSWRLSPGAVQRLGQVPLIVGDVGAAGVLDGRWKELGHCVHQLTFEPRTGTADANSSATHFAVALGASPGKQTLHITRFADSSSLYPIDYDRMSAFAVADLLEQTGEMPVELVTLDGCLEHQPALSPQFLKIDVEGAELDVLQGGERVLDSTVLGLRVEVSFVGRHLGAPLFGEIDAFLRAHGFELFSLSRELMMRRNLAWSPVSHPQLVWGDGVYFLTAGSFFARLRHKKPSEREFLLTRFIVILLAHRAHDYAMEIIERTESERLIEDVLLSELKSSVDQAARHSTRLFFKAVAGTVLAAMVYPVAWLSPATRPLATFFWKKRAGFLFFFLWRLCARGGERNASVSDGPI